MCCRLNERGLFDYLLLNDDLEATTAELERIAEVRGLVAPHQPASNLLAAEEGQCGAEGTSRLGLQQRHPSPTHATHL